jgi:uncharacterized membrane protein YphA (DoxX/SURF4 family)
VPIIIASALLCVLLLLYSFSPPVAWVVMAMMFVYTFNTRRERVLLQQHNEARAAAQRPHADV